MVEKEFKCIECGEMENLTLLFPGDKKYEKLQNDYWNENFLCKSCCKKKDGRLFFIKPVIRLNGDEQ